MTNYYTMTARELNAMNRPVTQVTPAVVLSRRQLAIMQDLVNGYTPQEISVRLKLGYGTIRKYMGRVKEKMNAPTMYQCVALLVQQGLVRPSPAGSEYE